MTCDVFVLGPNEAKQWARVVDQGLASPAEAISAVVFRWDAVDPDDRPLAPTPAALALLADQRPMGVRALLAAYFDLVIETARDRRLS